MFESKGFYYYLHRFCVKLGGGFKLIGDFFCDLPAAIIPAGKLGEIVGVFFDRERTVAHWSKVSDARLSDLEREFAQQCQSPKDSSILVIASGGGREAFGLAEMCFNVTAMDISEGTIAMCQEKAERENILNVQFVAADIYDFDPEQKFDYIMFSGRSYNYIPTRKRRIEVLQKIKGWLNDDGAFFLNFACGGGQNFARKKLYFPIYKCLAYVTFGNRQVQLGDSTTKEFFRHDFATSDEAMGEVREAGFVIEREGNDLFLRKHHGMDL